MKKILAVLLTFVFLFSLTACGSSTSTYETYTDSYNYDGKPSASPQYLEEGLAMPSEAPSEVEPTMPANGGEQAPLPDISASRKLIKNVWLNIEALEFDETISSIEKKVFELGGYIENSNIGGNSIYSSHHRDANLTIRIPADKVNEFVAVAEGLGNITNREESVKDITLTYVDTEARIKSLRTEYDRLLELLAEADSVDTIILLESRISEVRYQLESYESQLRSYDNQVSFSTIYLYINEVERITPAEKKGVWERIETDFGENLYDVGEGLTDFFVDFISGLPYLFVIAVVIAIIVFIIIAIIKLCKHFSEKRKDKRLKKLAENYAKAVERANAEGKPVPPIPYELSQNMNYYDFYPKATNDANKPE